MTRFRTGAAVTVAAAILVGVTGATGRVPGAASMPDEGSTSDAVVLTAVLLDADGRPLADTQVSLSALEDSADGSTRAVRLAHTVTDADGRFTLTGDPTGTPPDATGRVPLEVAVVDAPPEDGFVLDLGALPPGRNGGGWRLELPDGSTLTSGEIGAAGLGAAPAIRFQVGRGLLPARGSATSVERGTGDGVGGAGDGAVLAAPGLEARPAAEAVRSPGARRFGGATSCPPSMPSTGWAWRPRYRYPYVPTKYIRTRDKASFSWRIGRSHETSLGIAMDVAGDTFAGSLTGSVDDDESISWEPWAGNNKRRMFNLKWRYQKQRKWCMPASGTWILWLDVWRWLPRNPTGGNTITKTTATFRCGGTGAAYNDLFASKTTVSKESTAGYVGFFGIAGVTLNAKQKDRDKQVFTIIPDRGRTAKACGSNAEPATASLVKEVRR